MDKGVTGGDRYIPCRVINIRIRTPLQNIHIPRVRTSSRSDRFIGRFHKETRRDKRDAMIRRRYLFDFVETRYNNSVDPRVLIGLEDKPKRFLNLREENFEYSCNSLPPCSSMNLYRFYERETGLLFRSF